MTNIYDDESFFQQYAQMSRSRDGLSGAGEWRQLEPLFPALEGEAVLDLGCGYGWHCRYAASRGAAEVVGIDGSARMIEEAQRRNPGPQIQYQVCDLDAYPYPAARFGLVVSNLVLHYVQDLDALYRKVFQTLRPGGIFLFNIEHPVFTSGVRQEWVRDEDGKALHWPVDRYFSPGERSTVFLGQRVLKQHHTLTQILMGLLRTGFALETVEEAMPPEDMLDLPGMADELRRPMMLLVKARK